MTKRSIILTITASALMAVMTTGCVIKPYKSPENLPISDSLFRHDQEIDTVNNIAEMAWGDFFQDTLLCNLVQRVLENNLDMQVAQKRIEQYYAQLRMSRAAFAPSVGASLNGTYKGGSDQVPNSTASLGLNASWEIDIWGKILSAKRSALADLAASEDARLALQTSLVAQAARGYYQLIFLDTERQIVLETIKNRTEYLNTTRELKEAGKVNEVAVQQALAQLGEVKSALPNIELSIAQTENALSALCGTVSQSIRRSACVNIATVEFVPLSIGYPAELLSYRPDVRQAEQNYRSAFELYNVSRAALYPSLQISADGSFTELFSGQNLAFGILGGLTQPIFNGRKLRTQKEVAKLTAEQAEIGFRKAILTAGQEVSNALVAEQKYVQKSREQVKQLEALTKAYEYSTELFINGYANYLDVLVAQTGVFNTQISLLNTYVATIEARIELYRALGGGWR